MAKGKNFSTNNASGKRRVGDFYQTPFSLTRLLFDKLGLNILHKHDTFLEPSCGQGAISKVVREYGFDIDEADLDRGQDFLNYEGKNYDHIITNPPFSKALEFILKAKKVANKTIFMLLPLQYLHGIERYNKLWTDSEFPLFKVFVFTRYPMLDDKPLREDGKHQTGMITYAWFVWMKGWNNSPDIDWLDNNPFILSKKDLNTTL